MSLFDTDTILNSNPEKKLIISYDQLKKEYSNELARKHEQLYLNMPLSFVLNNVIYIIAEPQYGVGFFKHIAKNLFCEAFQKMDFVYNMILTYYNNHSSKMNDKQKTLYMDLIEEYEKFKNDHDQTIILSRYLESMVGEDMLSSFTDIIYNLTNNKTSKNYVEKKEMLMDFFTNENTNPYFFFIFAPYLTEATSTDFVTPALSRYYDMIEPSTPTEYELHKESVCNDINVTMILSKLMQDEAYKKAVSSIPNRLTKITLHKISETSLDEEMKELHTERVAVFDEYVSPEASVRAIFDDDDYFELAKDDYIREEKIRLAVESTVVKNISDLLLFENSISDVNEPVKGYNYFDSGITLEEAMNVIIEKESKIIGKDGSLGTGVLAQHSTNMREEESKDGKKKEKKDDDDDDDSHTETEDDFEDDEEENTSGKNIHTNEKKPPITAPKPKNLANKIQFKAMDAEAKQQRKLANAKIKMTEVKNAAKAVTQIPKNIMDSINQVAKDMETKDVEKRKDRMIDPGYRKKIISNLKKAVLYGSVTYVNLALLPVTLVLRHFSKSKDRRIRNELISELETEIKIVEEKINDANSNGDQKEKYKLMRIKSSLERETMRVKTNSKTI